VLCAFGYRNTYMNRLDKPTNSKGDNLLNINKTALIPVIVMTIDGLSKCLAGKILFFWLNVSNVKNQGFYVHLKSQRNNLVVEAES
jgi:hypothetical protein